MLMITPNNRFLLVGAFLLIVTIFVADLLIPPGVAVGILYVLVVLMLVRQNLLLVLMAAGITISLTLLTLIIQATSETSWLAYVNRALSVAAIAGAAIAAYVFDIARRNRTQQLHIENSHSLLEEKSRQLERYIFIASHNLNEPLQTITSFADILEEEHREELGEDARLYLGFITEAVAKMRAMIAGLLTYSRVGRTEKMGQVDGNELADELRKELARDVAAENGRLQFARPMPILWGAREEIKYVLRELITNALRYRSPDRDPAILITYADQDLHWVFCVADNGLGFRAEHKDKIFEMFTKLYRDDVYPGQGIGLAICSRITDLHMGEMWVESEHGMGSRFYFSVLKPPI